MFSPGRMLFDGDEIRVRATDHGGDLLVITFTHRMSAEPTEGFAEVALNRLNVSNIVFISRRPHWWQVDDMARAVAAVCADPLFARAGRRILYGSSMGGHAALHASNALGADHIVLISPQARMKPEAAPFEGRWREDVAAIPDFEREDLDRGLSRTARVTLFYDPAMPEDAAHADLVRAIRPVDIVPTRFMGHLALACLRDGGRLGDLLRAIVADEDASVLRHLVRQARGRSLVYLKAAASASLSRGRTTDAGRVIQRALALIDEGLPGHRQQVAKILNLAGRWRLDVGDPEGALGYHHQARKRAMRTAESYRGLRDFHARQGDLDLALAYAEKTATAPRSKPLDAGRVKAIRSLIRRRASAG
ncbi:hypothetical protein [Brevundimonas sp. Leaf363]|uniref:hypothetical protein n=1 Tax=Brevundimonas sp. Leaf363 TaxID=1736353 RepID=UPI00138F892E|nr:hypothetical protein [Brevundimonas sp. Leaf363]